MGLARKYFSPVGTFGHKWHPTDIIGGGDYYGDDFYLVTALNSTDTYYTWLTQNGISAGKIFATIGAAHTAMADGENDVLYVMPGVHSESTQVVITKDKISLVGVGGPISFNGSTGTNRIRV